MDIIKVTEAYHKILHLDTTKDSYIDTDVYSISAVWIPQLIGPGWIQINSFYINPPYRDLGYDSALAELLFLSHLPISIVSVLDPLNNIPINNGWHHDTPPNSYIFLNQKLKHLNDN